MLLAEAYFPVNDNLPHHYFRMNLTLNDSVYKIFSDELTLKKITKKNDDIFLDYDSIYDVKRKYSYHKRFTSKDGFSYKYISPTDAKKMFKESLKEVEQELSSFVPIEKPLKFHELVEKEQSLVVEAGVKKSSKKRTVEVVITPAPKKKANTRSASNKGL